MKWCVCLHKTTGEMYIYTRDQREWFLDICLKYGIKICTRVIAVKETRKEAIRYVEEIHKVNQLIERL